MADYVGSVCDFTSDPTKVVRGTRYRVLVENMDTGEVVLQHRIDLCNDPKCPAERVHTIFTAIQQKGQDERPAAAGKPAVKVEVPPDPPKPPATEGGKSSETKDAGEPVLSPLPNETLWGFVTRLRGEAGNPPVKDFTTTYLGLRDLASMSNIRAGKQLSAHALQRIAETTRLPLDVVSELQDRGVNAPLPGLLVFSDQ